MKQKIICFDIDGTLTDCKSSWVQITNKLELPGEKITEIYLKTEDGSMSFAKGEKLLKEIFLGRENSNRGNIMRLFEDIPPRKGAKELFDYLKANDYLIYLISGAIDVYADMISKQLGATGYFAHSSFIFDKNGVLCDIDYTSIGKQKHMKADYIRKLSKDHDIPTGEMLFAGDSANDLEAFKLTGRGIAVEPCDEILRPAAWKIVKELIEIKQISRF